MKPQTRKNNLWEVYAEQLASESKRLSDHMAEAMRGGDSPPGVIPVAASEQLRRFMLLSVPRALLDQQRLQEADTLWAEHYATRSETDIKKWALAMAREYQKLTVPASPLPTEAEEELIGVEPEMEASDGQETD